MIDLTVLATEINDDPEAFGYAGKGDSEIADLMNATDGTKQISRGSIPGWEILAQTVKSEYDAMSATHKSLYNTMIAAPVLDLSNVNIRAFFAAMFSPGTTTRDNLIAVSTRDGSRAEELFDTKVGIIDIARALGRA